MLADFTYMNTPHRGEWGKDRPQTMKTREARYFLPPFHGERVREVYKSKRLLSKILFHPGHHPFDVAKPNNLLPRMQCGTVKPYDLLAICSVIKTLCLIVLLIYNPSYFF